MPEKSSRERVSTVDALAEALRGEILNGSLPRGAPLREQDLSRLFGVSRHTIRTTIQVLSHLGLVNFEANKGAHVAGVDESELHDLFLARTALETSVVRLLAGAAGDLPSAAAHLERMGQAPAAERPEADLLFHSALVAAVSSPRLSAMFGGLLDPMRLAILTGGPPAAYGDLVLDQDRRLFHALTAGGPTDEVADMVSAHLRDACAALLAGCRGQLDK